MKKAWLIKVLIDNHTYNHWVMICDEKIVKSYCKGKTEESEFDNSDSDLNVIAQNVEYYSYEQQN